MKFNVKLLENGNVIIDDIFCGNLDDNIINYNDNVNNKFDLNKLLLERVSDEYKVTFDFLNFTCCSVVDGLSVNMMIEVISKEICPDSLFFKYKIVDTGYVYEYSISW